MMVEYSFLVFLMFEIMSLSSMVDKCCCWNYVVIYFS